MHEITLAYANAAKRAICGDLMRDSNEHLTTVQEFQHKISLISLSKWDKDTLLELNNLIREIRQGNPDGAFSACVQIPEINERLLSMVTNSGMTKIGDLAETLDYSKQAVVQLLNANIRCGHIQGSFAKNSETFVTRDYLQKRLADLLT